MLRARLHRQRGRRDDTGADHVGERQIDAAMLAQALHGSVGLERGHAGTDVRGQGEDLAEIGWHATLASRAG
jgi:hypothetical protein